jgi:hypothetical protein
MDQFSHQLSKTFEFVIDEEKDYSLRTSYEHHSES